MTATTVVSIAAFCVAVVSLLLSLAVAYTQNFQRARLSLIFGDIMRTYYTPSGEVVAVLSITLLNDGARLGAVHRLTGRLASIQPASEAPLSLTAFLKAERVDDADGQFLVHQRFAGFPETIVIPPRTALTKTVQLMTDRPFALQEGRHVLELFASSGAGTVRTTTRRASFALAREQLLQLQTTSGPKGTIVNTAPAVVKLTHD